MHTPVSAHQPHPASPAHDAHLRTRIRAEPFYRRRRCRRAASACDLGARSRRHLSAHVLWSHGRRSNRPAPTAESGGGAAGAWRVRRSTQYASLSRSESRKRSSPRAERECEGSAHLRWKGARGAEGGRDGKRSPTDRTRHDRRAHLPASGAAAGALPSDPRASSPYATLGERSALPR